MSREESLPGGCFDVLIVGGGPAGSSTALALARRGLSAVVLERSSYDSVRVGETVPPEIREPLAALGLWRGFLEEKHAPSFANVSSWGEPAVSRRQHICNPYGRGWHLERNRFDSWLAAAARCAGAAVLETACGKSFAEHDGLWTVGAIWRGRTITMRAGYLVDATGRSACVARRLGARRHLLNRLVGLTAYLTPEAGSPPLESTVLLEAVEEGWWYSAPLPDGRAVAALMADAGLAGASPRDKAGIWWRHLNRSRLTRERLQACPRPASVTLRPAGPAFTEPAETPRFLMAGDAAAAFDPLSSQGILKALRSGIATAEAILADREGTGGALEEHRRDVLLDFSRHLDLLAFYYGLEARWPESSFWKPRRAASQPAMLRGFLHSPDRQGFSTERRSIHDDDVSNPSGDRHRPDGRQRDRLVPGSGDARPGARAGL